MTSVTRYPIDPEHEPLYRGDPVAIGITITDNTAAPGAPPVFEPRDLTGTFWRAYIRQSDDGRLLTRFTVEVLDDGIDATLRGKLLMRLTGDESQALVNGCVWDLEQVTNDLDDDSTDTIATYWKVRSAKVVKDVSHG